jgi:hypothetical protein
MKNALVLLVLLGVTFAGLSVDDFTLNREFYKPGDPGVTTVSVSNPTGAERVTAITMSIDSPPEILVTSAPQLADIGEGGSAIVSIPFKVAPNAKPGIYLINVIFRGFVSGDTAGSSQTSVNTAAIPVTVVNEPILSVSSGSQLISGITDFALTITNNGGLARNVRVRIDPASPIAFSGQDSAFVSQIEKSVAINATLDSRGAPDGPIDIPFVLEYEDELGNLHNSSAPMRMTVRNEKLNLQFNQQTELFTRKESSLILELVNNGETNLKDVRLSFLNSSIRLKNEEELKFGDIPAGGKAAVTTVVFTDAPPGVNSIDSLLTYIEKDVQKEETRKVPLTLTSDADVQVYLEAKPLPLTIGSEHTISVLVSNLGSYEIENVDVSLSSPVLRPLDISDKQYIGGLQRDDFSTVQFLVKVNTTEEGNKPIYVRVSYRDQSGELKEKMIERSISIYPQQSDGGSPLPLIAAALVIAAALWHFFLRKKKV